jgi:hypothetical protein
MLEELSGIQGPYVGLSLFCGQHSKGEDEKKSSMCPSMHRGIQCGKTKRDKTVVEMDNNFPALANSLSQQLRLVIYAKTSQHNWQCIQEHLVTDVSV